MYKEVFEEISFNINVDQLKETLQLRSNKRTTDMIDKLLKEANNIAKPKAIYIQAPVVSRGEDFIVVDGTSFHSENLRVNTNGLEVVFPYVITCGTEIEQWSENIENIMEKYIADGIKAIILSAGTDFVSNHIKQTFDIKELSYSIPGSFDDWPMNEQTLLFKMIGDVTELIGVRLTESSLMRPTKSVSGIYYEI
ncbi:MAG: vitamin B12 dependent-methionine synthase activation domain-containing protein [Eubacteriaceae bacterium]